MGALPSGGPQFSLKGREGCQLADTLPQTNWGSGREYFGSPRLNWANQRKQVHLNRVQLQRVGPQALRLTTVSTRLLASMTLGPPGGLTARPGTGERALLTPQAAKWAPPLTTRHLWKRLSHARKTQAFRQ